MSNSLQHHGLACQAPLSQNSSAKNTGVCCHSHFQGFFLTHGSNLGLLHCMLIIYHLSHQGSPKKHVKLNTFFDTQKSCTCNKLCQNKNTKTNKTNNTTKKTNQEKESKIYIWILLEGFKLFLNSTVFSIASDLPFDYLR